MEIKLSNIRIILNKIIYFFIWFKESQMQVANIKLVHECNMNSKCHNGPLGRLIVCFCEPRPATIAYRVHNARPLLSTTLPWRPIGVDDFRSTCIGSIAIFAIIFWVLFLISLKNIFLYFSNVNCLLKLLIKRILKY